MEQVIKVIQTLWDQLEKSPSHLLLIVALFGLGVILKKSPLPNGWIPLILCALGTCIYPLIAEATLSAYQRFEHPKVILAIYGFALALGAILLHGLAKRSEKYRAMEEALTNSFRGDTQVFKKPESDA